MVARSAMPSAATHHRSSFAPIQPHGPAGPLTWPTISLGSASVSSCCHAPLPRRARRFAGSSTSGSLPTSDSVAPAPRPRSTSDDDVEFVRRRTGPSMVHTTPSGAIDGQRREIDVEVRGARRRAGALMPGHSSGFTTVSPAGPAPATARPSPSAVSPTAAPNRRSAVSIGVTSAVVSFRRYATAPPSATLICSPSLSASIFASARPPYPSTSTTEPDGAMHEPARRRRRRGIDRRQSVGAEQHHHADERDDDRNGGGDGLTPGHSGCVHLNLTGGLADGWSGNGGDA